LPFSKLRGLRTQALFPLGAHYISDRVVLIMAFVTVEVLIYRPWA
jgi:hypothetical protein